MKTKEEMIAFAEGYLRCALYDEHTGESIKGVDEWVYWDEYDINLFGQDYTEDVPEYALKVVVYPKHQWTATLPESLNTFIVQQ